MHHMAPRPQQAVKPHPVFNRHDLARVSGAHRGDGIGTLQPRFQKANPAKILHPVDAEGRCRKAKRAKDGSRKMPLKSQIMNRHDGFGPAAIAHIGRNKPRLPVVAMDDVRHEIRHQASSDFRGNSCQRRKAL